MAKVHKSALGRPIDMAALRAKNEQVRAVGNMSCNARGDIIDANGRVINDNTKRVNEHYMKSVKPKTVLVNRPVDRSPTAAPPPPPMTPVSESKIIQSRPAPDPDPVIELTKEELEFEQDDIDQIPMLPETKKKSSKKLD